MIRLQKRLVSIFIFFMSTMLCLPITAQDMMLRDKLYCPYCDLANFITSKFCGACGSRLPQPLASSDMPRLRLVSTTTLANDSLGAKILYDDEIVQHYRQQGSIAWPIAGGVLAGGAGFLAGGFLGASCTYTPNADFSGIGGFIVGAPIGEAIGLPIGVHLGNGRRGNLPLAMFASMGIVGTGIVVTAALDDYRAPVITLPVTALTQFVACVAIERGTTRTNRRENTN